MLSTQITDRVCRFEFILLLTPSRLDLSVFLILYFDTLLRRAIVSGPKLYNFLESIAVITRVGSTALLSIVFPIEAGQELKILWIERARLLTTIRYGFCSFFIFYWDLNSSATPFTGIRYDINLEMLKSWLVFTLKVIKLEKTKWGARTRWLRVLDLGRTLFFTTFLLWAFFPTTSASSLAFLGLGHGFTFRWLRYVWTSFELCILV